MTASVFCSATVHFLVRQRNQSRWYSLLASPKSRPLLQSIYKCLKNAGERQLRLMLVLSKAYGILRSDTVAVKKMNENDENKMLQVLISYHMVCLGLRVDVGTVA
ncbi:hypothetical protein Y032_0026g1319 [Ancylostoma ceylanicum]|uniref:Uncharacterized protein n=1 Tax=Ancylostoma ceylanicum TaxID=53326 RepID=A0A016UTE4_9BILA|nr:hypothetical protein Y032_0026g1319 [Ancylostoma ceylanicum]